jgi:hypothetical protein
MLKRTILLTLVAGAVACGPPSNGPDPKTGGPGPDGEDGKSGATATGKKVEEGSSVCVSNLLGVRYAIEDVLEEVGLKVTGDCMFADVEIAEQGEPGAFELKYRALGEEWQSCKSTAQDRIAFVKECTDAIVTTSGGAKPAPEGDDKGDS